MREYKIDTFAAIRQMNYLIGCGSQLKNSYLINGDPLKGTTFVFSGMYGREFEITIRPDGNCTTNLDCFLQSKEAYIQDVA